MNVIIIYTEGVILIIPIYVVSCGQPPPPRNGHIVPNNFSTLEGATVSYVCWNIYQEEDTSLCTDINTTAVCNNNGNWEPDSQDRCSVFSAPGKIENHDLIPI